MLKVRGDNGVSGNRGVVKLSSNGRGKIQNISDLRVRGDNGVSDDREVAV